MIYEVNEARKLLAAGWTVVKEAGDLYSMTKGKQSRRLHRNAARVLGYSD